MKILSTAVAVALTVFVMLAVPVTLQKSNKVQAQQSNQNQQQQNSETVYKYVAQPGDSYSKIARKAVQTYGLKNKVNLSNAKILFAETNLTKEAGSPSLAQGQVIEVKESAVKKWADQAKDLSQQKEAAWNAYTAGVNFDTRLVGQAK